MSVFDENQEQLIYPVTIIRGGTSRALFFKEGDLPGMDDGQPGLLAAAMGRPDPLEVDGLGGGKFNTSKVAIVGISKMAGVDLEYTFVQVEPDSDIVDYNANCGNIASGVPIFALDKQMLNLPDGENEVRIFNTNTKKMLYARLKVQNGKALVRGDYVMPGVPGAGSKIFMDFRDTVGASTGAMFPTGNKRDILELDDGTSVAVTVCDVSNLVVFIDSRDVGLDGRESLGALAANEGLFLRCEEIRGKAAKLAGLVDDWHKAGKSFIPPVCLVSRPVSYEASDHCMIERGRCSLIGKLVVADSMHPTFMGTGSCCIAAAANVKGTVPFALREQAPGDARFLLGHPGGVMELEVESGGEDASGVVSFKRLGFGRTARKIADCTMYINRETLKGFTPEVVLPTDLTGIERA
jgi:2-methylaconitate cis-trans-isomerase PrpF